MALVVHIDKASLDRAPLASPVVGKLFEGRIARTHAPGDPLVYGPDDFEYRTADELAKILDHIVGHPVTLLHPAGLISEGAEAVIVGHIIGARIDDDTLVAQMFITDPLGIEAIENGVLELSMGYRANVTVDHYQQDIQVDHVAIVPRARCGEACALKADSNAEPAEKTTEIAKSDCGCGCDGGVTIGDHKVNLPTCQDARTMPILPSMTLEEIQKQLDETKTALDAANKRASDAEATLKAKQDSAVASQVELDNAKKDLKVAQGALEAEKARADQAVTDAEVAVAKAKADAKDEYEVRLKEEVAKRGKLLADATGVLPAADDQGAKIDYSAKTDRELKVAVIKHVDGDDVADDALEAYVDGMYEGALRRHAKAGVSRAAVRETIAANRGDAKAAPLTGDEAEKAALEEYKRNAATAWAEKTN